MKQTAFADTGKASAVPASSDAGSTLLHPMQRKVDESPRQRAQQEQLSRLSGGSARARPNGLPLPLRTGIEALSGMDMSGVVVHRNSAKPAQLNALAYAQGQDIHLGSGQERHLPHEAWHVVQQRQGRVGVTTRHAGVPINDDGSLEREADLMGARAVRMQADTTAGATGLAGRGQDTLGSRTSKYDVDGSAQPVVANGATGGAPLQLLRKQFPTTRPANDPVVANHQAAVEQVVQEVERRVDHARGLALNWHVLDFNDTGYVGLWARTAKAYLDDPETVPDFIHARFGYAIETFACGNLPNQHAGLSIHFQVSTGHTRPDIVLTDSTNAVVGWLDITSSDSADHILGKDGAGWRTKPFVYEIYYPPLSLPEVLTGLQDPVYKAWGEYLSVKSDITHEIREEKRIGLRNSLLNLQETNQWTTGTGNATNKKNATKNLLAGLGVPLGNAVHKATRGALAVSDINDGLFGYNVGNTGVDSNPAKTFIKNQAAPEIRERHDEIDVGYLEHYQDVIASHQDLPLIENFYAYLCTNDSRKIEIGTAVAASIEEYEALEALWENMRASTDQRAVLLAGQLLALVEHLPVTVHFDALRAWSNESVALRNKAEILGTVIQEQQHFLDYLLVKYGALAFFSRTPEENFLVNALNQMPEDTTIALRSRTYRENHPVAT